jgi:predicted nucleotidyltransferase
MGPADEDPRLIELNDAVTVAVSTRAGWVVVQWHGPRRAEITPEAARTLGYVLRSYARMTDQENEPGT